MYRVEALSAQPGSNSLPGGLVTPSTTGVPPKNELNEPLCWLVCAINSAMTERLSPGDFYLYSPKSGGLGASLFGSLGRSVNFGRSSSLDKHTQERIGALIRWVPQEAK